MEVVSTATSLDPATIRKDFPALLQEVAGHPLVYLDNAATTQKPQSVIDAIVGFYRRDNANVHRGIHELSRRATEAYEGARVRIASWIGAAEPAEVVFTRGTTEGLNLVASSWGDANLRAGDEIVLSTLEHHSNIVPWQMIAARTRARIRYVDIDEEGRLPLDRFSQAIGDRTRVVALTHVSNALGTVNPIAEIARLARERGALFVVDGAQGAAHLRVDVQELACDFYALSGHKMLGPMGVGALWGRRELFEELTPYQGGGEMIRTVGAQESTWAEVPHKFEAGTPNVAGAVGFAAAVDYLAALDPVEVMRHERELVAHAVEGLSRVEGVQVLGPSAPEERVGVVSFVMDGAHPHDIATILDAEGVAIRAGHHCAQLLMRRLGTPATSRASFFFYNTHQDVDRLLHALRTVRSIFSR